MALLSTVVTGALAAAITNYYQRQQFKWTERETREAEIRRQREAFVLALMGRVSTRVYSLLKVIGILTSDELLSEKEIEKRVTDYQQAVKDTAVNYSKDLLFLTEYFSPEVSNIYSNQVMQGPNGFVPVGREWRHIFNNFLAATTGVRELLKSDKLTLEERQELTDTLKEVITLFNKRAKGLEKRAQNFGYKPVSDPFYKVITAKEIAEYRKY